MGDVEELARDPLMWFPHDADAASDPKCRRLIRSMGAAGYGRFWLLCEALASEVGHALPVLTANDWENLAVTLDMENGEEASEFVAELCAIGLVDVLDGTISSARMNGNAVRVGRKRAAGRKGGKAKAENASSTAKALP